MKLSAVTRYGLRALFDLCSQGRKEEGRPVPAGDIARRQEIPLSYLEQLFIRLRRGNLVKSVRGAQGGYMLARPADEITVAEIVRILGEPIAFGNCQTDVGCRNVPQCPTYGLWQRLKNAIDDILENTTLEDLTKECRENADESNAEKPSGEKFFDPVPEAAIDIVDQLKKHHTGKCLNIGIYLFLAILTLGFLS